MIMSFKMHCTGEAILENNLTRRTAQGENNSLRDFIFIAKL